MSYLPVRVKTLKSGITLGFDLYIKLPHKTLKYFSGQESVDEGWLNSVKGKSIKKLYLIDEQEELYHNYIDRCLSDVVDDPNLTIEEKADVVMDAAENTAERIYEDPHSKEAYVSAQKTTKSLMDLFAKNDELLKGIFDRKVDEASTSKDDIMHRHSANAASMAISFGEHVGLDSEVVQNIGVAALFHDIAYGQMDDKGKALFFKDISKMDASELTIYKSHPKTASEILQDKEFASKEIITYILNHEERRSGEGFPSKTTKIEMDQEVLNLCCYYDLRVTCYGESWASVLEHLSIDQIGNFDLDLLKKFKAFLKATGLR